jgi:hypothetical protein
MVFTETQFKVANAQAVATLAHGGEHLVEAGPRAGR